MRVPLRARLRLRGVERAGVLGGRGARERASLSMAWAVRPSVRGRRVPVSLGVCSQACASVSVAELVRVHTGESGARGLVSARLAGMAPIYPFIEYLLCAKHFMWDLIFVTAYVWILGVCACAHV